MGVVASPLVFWLIIGYGSNDLGRFYLRRAGADRDVLGDLLDDLDHRRPARGLSALDAGLARAAHQHGARQDSRLGHTGLDPGTDLSVLRSAGRRVASPLIDLIPVAAAIFLISFTLTGLGFVIAWRMDSTAGFHAIMNLLLVPMWMVSGSLFPMARRTAGSGRSCGSIR